MWFFNGNVLKKKTTDWLNIIKKKKIIIIITTRSDFLQETSLEVEEWNIFTAPKGNDFDAHKNTL